MKIKELIEVLKNLDCELDVCIYDEIGHCYEIHNVDVEEKVYYGENEEGFLVDKNGKFILIQ